MKKNKILPLILLCAVAVFLLILFLVLKKAEEEEQNPSVGAEDYFTVMTIDQDKVDRITISNGQFDGVFVRSNGIWNRSDADFFPVKQPALTGIENVLLANLRAFSKVETPADLAEYGLEQPVATLKAYVGDTMVCGIFLGDKLPTKDQYYCMFDGDDAVYTVSANYAKYMRMTGNDFLAELELPNISDTALLREIQITGTEFRNFHAKYEPNNPYDYSGVALFPWVIYEPLTGACFADPMNGVWLSQMNAYCSLRYEKLVMYRSNQLEKYGLETPSATLTVLYTDSTGTDSKKYVLHLGSKLADGSYYAMLEGEEWIFTVSASDVERKFASNVYEWAYHTVIYPVTNHFSEINIQTQAGWYSLENSGRADTDGNPIFTLNGKDLSAKQISTLREQILTLKTSGYIVSEEPYQEEPILVMHFIPNTEALEDMSIHFYSYSDGLYEVCINECIDFSIDSRDVDAFIKYFDDAFQSYIKTNE